MKEEFGAPQDDKDVYVGGKYNLKDANSQLKDVLAQFKEHSEIEFTEAKAEGGDEAPAEGAAEEEKKDDAPAEDAMMEGGDEMMMADEDLYKDDSGDYKGFKNFPNLLLKQTVVNPYFGDLVKAA